MNKGKYSSARDQDWTDIEVTPIDPTRDYYFLSRDEVEFEGNNAFKIVNGKRVGYVPLTRCAFVKFIYFSGGDKPTVPELP